MKKILLLVFGILLLSGCQNKEMLTFYENTKVGDKTESYQLDLRIYGNYDSKTYNEIVKIDNYKETQYKIDYISNQKEEIIEETNEETNELEMPLRVDNASYRIDQKNYEQKDGVFVEVESLMYTNPNAYLEVLSKASNVETLKEEKIGLDSYKTYSFKVNKKDMEAILKDGALKDLKLKSDVSAKVWIDKDNRVYKVIYYLIEGKDKVEINASFFRFNIIKDMKNNLR